jgi:type III restriction enzyme
MLRDLEAAKIVITNYHAFRLREKFEVSKVGRSLLQGAGDPIETLETEGEMLRRVMPDLMGTKGIVVLNDEAHHCYRERPRDKDVEALSGDDKAEADENNKAARLWISGIEAVKRKMGLNGVFDLSATPFFLRGSGYAEGTLFPWTVSDFSLMDAIECGIVKLPRIPVSDNVTDDVPRFRNLWDNIRKDMPKKGRGGGKDLNPMDLPNTLQTALNALYGHYTGEFDRWEAAGIAVPPVFIVVCNNTSTSKLVYDWISGYTRVNPDGSSILQHGQLKLFRNHDDHGNPHPRPRTLLIDSTQLESGDALDAGFREAAGPEIEQFRRDLIERRRDANAGANVTDQDLLREVMNTVGKEGRLGEQVRCVVSVSMLTEGWDANTVTHILGIRAFGTQLLCEQVVGRALRRQSYRLNDQGLFDVEYADILGIPFDFASKPVPVKPATPVKTVRVKAMPERAHLAITFPRVEGYRTELPPDDLQATFTEDSYLDLTPDLLGPTSTLNQGIVGKSVDLTVDHMDMRRSTVLFHLAQHLTMNKYRDEDGQPRMGLFNPLKRVARQWLEGGYLRCSPGLNESHMVEYREILDRACNKIKAGITEAHRGERKVLAIIDPYNPSGSTRFVNFTTSKPTRLTDRSHVNLVVLDSDWEAVMCHVLDTHPKVLAYVKNQNLGFDVPYVEGSTPRRYLSDFIVRVDDGHDDPLNLIVEVKGYRGEDARIKAETMRTYWVPGVNNLGAYGRWAFHEFKNPWTMQHEFAARIEPALNKMLDLVAHGEEPAYA